MDWVPVPRAHSAGLTISPCRVRVAPGPYNDMFVFPFVYAIQRATFSIWPRRSRLLDTSGAGQVLATLRNIKKHQSVLKLCVTLTGVTLFRAFYGTSCLTSNPLFVLA